MSPATVRRRGSAARFGAVVAMVLAGLACVGGLLWAAGWLHLPGSGGAAGDAAAVHAPPGTIPVPVSASAIPAYTQITRDQLLDPKTLQIHMAFLDPAKLPADVITKVSSILGRVLAEAKAPDYVFRESEFLPEGTRPGLVAGIPPGKRAMRIELSKITGFYGLREGDHFDLTATLAIQATAKDLGRLPVGHGGAEQLALNAELTNSLKQATVHVVVQDGVVVSPMETRQVPYTVNSLTQGSIVRTKPVQEIVIAVAPEEVVRLTEALAVNADLACVPRSGRPDDPQDSRTPDRGPDTGLSALGAGGLPGIAGGAGGMTFIERIEGDQREIRAIPSRPAGGN